MRSAHRLEVQAAVDALRQQCVQGASPRSPRLPAKLSAWRRHAEEGARRRAALEQQLELGTCGRPVQVCAPAVSQRRFAQSIPTRCERPN
jgi:hypothetical protein